ncbi:hypothetical protein [Agromyces aureus]|uniref:Uncharacterized protein n=1 Tax=Agromyces aureus TaxID=453304 RepID=A0A191WB50_9MICO|nr:hypothetical protein [Agromyces aureus]ANJ25467.1 hypothetical protein ATC03_00470 [Agromyces aureus]
MYEPLGKLSTSERYSRRMDVATVALEPWSPWPLVFPVLVVIGGAVLTFFGQLRNRRWMRDVGAVVLVGGGLTTMLLLAFLSGNWDQAQRKAALEELGYSQPTFSGGTGIVGGQPDSLDFNAVRDGEPVTGTLQWQGEDRWKVVEGNG